MRTRLRFERVARLERGRGASAAGLCDCAGQLQAIGEARVAVDDNGVCRYCGRPVTLRWSQFGESLQRVYGGVEHGSGD